MAKQIVFEYKDNLYTLEFTRETVKTLENRGFDIKSMDTKMLTTLETLFEGAFLANHKRVKKETIKEILNKVGNKEGLIEKLAEMYYEPLTVLFDEPEDEEGKVEWEASF